MAVGQLSSNSKNSGLASSSVGVAERASRSLARKPPSYKAGVTFHQALRTEPWSARTFIVQDPDGNLIAFSGHGV
ncbi:VOC family protein [Sinorhizobium numidicum]|uniref:VOC family protein n=1 Tax=Sinorhizobium numidicum TaxID=680248 RepID=UPI003CC8DA53